MGGTMIKYLTYVLIIFGLLLTACNNDTKTVDDVTDETLDETSDNDSNTYNEGDTSEETVTDSNGTTKNSNDSDQPTDDPIEQPTSEEAGRYSSDDAVRLVKEYLEAEGLYMEMNYLFDGEDDNGHYRIQVFEVVDNGEGNTHTATYGWYLVDPETGTITDLFN